MSNNPIDFDNFNIKEFQKEFAERAKAGQPFTGKGGILTPLFKKLLEGTLDGKGDTHYLAECETHNQVNRRNGH